MRTAVRLQSPTLSRVQTCLQRSVPPSPESHQLPILGSAAERADAARNRQRILAAAGRLFARDGVACTSMEAIAAEAGVGKGTVFRRFGDRASLALALLESCEREFQEGFIRGPAPLGPGAPPLERLIAFGHALLRHVAAHGELLLAGQTAGTPSSRFDVGAYSAYHTHVTILLREAQTGLDAEHASDVLLAPLCAEVVLYQLHARAMTMERIAAGWEQLVRRLLAPPRA